MGVRLPHESQIHLPRESPPFPLPFSLSCTWTCTSTGRCKYLGLKGNAEEFLGLFGGDEEFMKNFKGIKVSLSRESDPNGTRIRS